MTTPGRTLVAGAVGAARFLPIWLATGVLVIVAAIIAPASLEHTSWAFVLPYMTVLAVAALGQMLVVSAVSAQSEPCNLSRGSYALPT